MATKTTRPNTQNAGASLERQAIMKKVRMMARACEVAGQNEAFSKLIDLKIWIIGRVARDNKTPGGLGKKTTKSSKKK